MDVVEAMDDNEILRLPVQLVLVGDELLVDSVGLSVRPGADLTMQSSERAISNLNKVDKGLHFWLGDLVNLVDPQEWGSQVLDASCGFPEGTLRADASVARRVPEENRRIAQSFGHALVVAHLTPAKQREWLETSRSEDWAIAKLKTEMAASGDGGRKKLIHILIIDCGTEAKQEKLAKQLEADGFKCTKRSAVKREKKDKAVTAKKRKKAKMSATKRVPA